MKMMNVDDLSKMMKVSRIWIYKLCREKRIPWYRIESCIRFDPQEIQEWLEERKVEASGEDRRRG
jgi:excisionase family DNA binding protein